MAFGNSGLMRKPSLYGTGADTAANRARASWLGLDNPDTATMPDPTGLPVMLSPLARLPFPGRLPVIIERT